MGRSDTAEASIGISVDLEKLIECIDETNFDTVKKMLEDGVIDDENDFVNADFNNLVEILWYSKDWKWDEVKSLLLKRWKEQQSSESKKSAILLVKSKTLVCTTRWGHNRCGTNASCAPIGAFDVEEEKTTIRNKYGSLGIDYEIVFIQTQRAG